MPVLHQYDYIFAIGTLFALLDAYNNGASKFALPPRTPSIPLVADQETSPTPR